MPYVNTLPETAVKFFLKKKYMKEFLDMTEKATVRLLLNMLKTSVPSFRFLT